MNQPSLYLLDTNTVSYILNGRSILARQTFLQRKVQGSIAVSALTQAETLFGLERKTGATRFRSAVQEFFDGLPILPWDHHVAPIYARLRMRLTAGGISLSAIDMLLAAQASSLNATLVTTHKAFAHVVPLLRIENWATDL